MVVSNRFIFEYCLFIRAFYLSKHSITFENTYLLISWFYCVDIFMRRISILWNFRSHKSKTRILLTEILHEYRTIKLPYIYTLVSEVSVNWTVLNFLPSFRAFHIPLILHCSNWKYHCSNWKYQKYARCFDQSDYRYFAFQR